MSRRAQPVTLEPTFLATFQRRVREHPERVFMRQADSAARTGYRDVTFREADEQARRRDPNEAQQARHPPTG